MTDRVACRKCGQEIPVGAQVCHLCGYALRGKARAKVVTQTILSSAALIASTLAIWLLLWSNWQTDDALRIQTEQLELQRQSALQSDSLSQNILEIARTTAQSQRQLFRLILQRDSVDWVKFVETERPNVTIGKCDCTTNGQRVTVHSNLRNDGASTADDTQVWIDFRNPDGGQIMDHPANEIGRLSPGQGRVVSRLAPVLSEFVARVRVSWTWSAVEMPDSSTRYFHIVVDTTEAGRCHSYGISLEQLGRFWPQGN